MISVKLPNGQTAQFPDGTSREVMKAAIQKKFPPQGGPKTLQGTVTPQAAPPSEGSTNIENRTTPAYNWLDNVTASIENTIGGIPVLGPAVQNVSDAMIGTGSTLMGGDYAQTVQAQQEGRKKRAQQYPLAATVGNLTGNVGAYMGLGTIPAAAQALGLTGKLLPRVANSALTSGAITGADSAIKGKPLNDVLADATYSAGIGGAIPVVGAGIRGAIGGIGRKAQPLIGAMTNAPKEAQRRAGVALTRDMTGNPQQVVNAADEAVAREAGVPLLNADRGGETTRALARSVANQSPEARATIENAASDRFAGQGQRATEFVKRLTGGSVDDIGYQRSIQDAARTTNRPAYNAAYEAPAARAVWTPEIRQLMQSPDFRAAITATERTAANDAAISGFKAVKNPFVFRPDGSVSLGKLPGGATALPSLQFWDVVQRNLRKAQEALAPTEKHAFSQLGQMRSKLLESLDTAVPQFQKARQGAASFFGAENALEAGKKFATSPKLVPEAREAFMKFTGAERKAFATGYASSIIDTIRATGDRVNVINRIFKSQASREMMELVFGKAKAKQIEAYVRVEDLADRLRGAMGNSTTARQLVELGIGAGSGYAFSGGDWKGALGGAALAKGARYVGGRVDNRVMQEVAKLLMSDDPAMLKKAVYNASMSDEWMRALERLSGLIAAPAARGASMAAVGQ